MKLIKRLTLLSLAIIIFISVPFNIAEAQHPERDIKIWINDFYIMSDVHPFIENNRAFVPIRFIAEELGYEVNWHQKTKTASIEAKNIEILLQIDSDEVIVNGKKQYLDMPARLREERTFVPFRAVAELFEEKIEYDDIYRTAIIGSDYEADVYYPLKYYLKNKTPFITVFKVNFVEYVIRFSDGRLFKFETEKEIFRSIDEEGQLHKEIEFERKVEEDKQLHDRHYVAPIESDPFVGSWYGIGALAGSYVDAYAYIEKIGDNKYLFVKRWINSNGTEIIAESYATYDPEREILFKEESHNHIEATEGYADYLSMVHKYQELKVDNFDYMYWLYNPDVFLRKY